MKCPVCTGAIYCQKVILWAAVIIILIKLIKKPIVLGSVNFQHSAQTLKRKGKKGKRQ